MKSEFCKCEWVDWAVSVVPSGNSSPNNIHLLSTHFCLSTCATLLLCLCPTSSYLTLEVFYNKLIVLTFLINCLSKIPSSANLFVVVVLILLDLLMCLFYHQLSDGIQAMADTGEVKLVLVVNNELKMGKGKIAAQVVLVFPLWSFPFLSF